MRSLVVLVVLTLCFGIHAEFDLCGVNEAGLEFGESLPGVVNTDYALIPNSSIDYFFQSGMNVIRLPFTWERLQSKINSTLDPAYLSYIQATVQYATGRNMFVILDVHNYGRWRNNVIGNNIAPVSSFYNLWYQLATVFKGNKKVIFGLMNEPNTMAYAAVLAFQNAGIQGARDAGARNLILVCGNDWSGVHSWMNNNAQYMINIVDPLNNFMFEMHQYFDTDYSGRNSCNTTFNLSNVFEGTTNWLRTNKKTAFIGEMGINDSPECIAIFQQTMDYLKANSDVWKGFTYWAAGPWWGSYPYSVESPTGITQMNTMKSVIPATYPTFNSDVLSPSSSEGFSQSFNVLLISVILIVSLLYM